MFITPPPQRVSSLIAAYKAAALRHKHSGDSVAAMGCLRTAKQLMPLQTAIREGQQVRGLFFLTILR